MSSQRDVQQLLDMRIITSRQANAFSRQGVTERSRVACCRTTWDRCGKTVPPDTSLARLLKNIALCYQYVTYTLTPTFSPILTEDQSVKKAYLVHPFPTLTHETS